jgi:Restriction endonuclease
LADTLRYSPDSWKRWIKEGHRSIFKFTRNVAKQKVVPAMEQRPIIGSGEEETLSAIYNFYTGKKHRFELLAAEVARRILSGSGGVYFKGWVTPPAGDGGADFVGRLDVGSGFSVTKIVVLGQAKCESPHSVTSGIDIARTVARLRRGWIGVYITTSYFSERAQQEVIEDQYPILLVHGRRLAEEVIRLVSDSGFATVGEYLEKLDMGYPDQVAQRRAEEILLL